MKFFLMIVIAWLAAACSSTQVYSNLPVSSVRTTPADSIAVYYSGPTQPFEVIGVVSAKRYKPGWTDPTVSDAIPQLRQAASQLGADAVVVRSSRSNNDRHTVVEAEAIRFLSQAPSSHPVLPATSLQENAGTTSSSTVGSPHSPASRAQEVSTKLGCGNVEPAAESEGRAVFLARCPSGSTVEVDCSSWGCKSTVR